jgi:hypothetical protein
MVTFASGLDNGENATTWLHQVIQPAIFVENHAVYNFPFSNSLAMLTKKALRTRFRIYMSILVHTSISLFQNGTTNPTLFKASYDPKEYSLMASITGEQAYNRFVKAKPTTTASPSASASASATAAATATTTSLQRLPLPYPQHPVIVQPGLGADLRSGFV